MAADDPSPPQPLLTILEGGRERRRGACWEISTRRDVSREFGGAALGGAGRDGPGRVVSGRAGPGWGLGGGHGAAAGAAAEQGDPAAVLQQAPQGRHQIHHGQLHRDHQDGQGGAWAVGELRGERAAPGLQRGEGQVFPRGGSAEGRGALGEKWKAPWAATSDPEVPPGQP